MMKKFMLLLILFLPYFSLYGQSYFEMEMDAKGHIIYRGKKMKLKHLKPLIYEKQDTHLNSLYKKARNKNLMVGVLGRIRDFGLFYAVINEPFNPIVQPIPLAIGLGGLAGNIKYKKTAKRAIAEMVDYFNQ